MSHSKKLIAELGRTVIYHESHGDTWQNAWLDDDRVFTLSCDCLGWNRGCEEDGSNWALNELTGDFTKVDGLRGCTINPMKTRPFDYGRWAYTKYDQDALMRMWKANSIAHIDGALYVSVSRHGAMLESNGYIQDSINAGIIKSEDYGNTWSRSEYDCYADPMFKDNIFPLPCFIEYYRGNGPVPMDREDVYKSPDDSDKYIYLLSNDGYWNNGSKMYLARVPRERFGAVDARDWQFLCDIPKTSGINDQCWSNDPMTKTAILENPFRLSMAGARYVWPLKRYIMTQAYFPEPYSQNFDTSTTCFEFYEAPAPWGPWTSFYHYEFKGEGYYTPEILSKSIKVNEDNSCSMIILTAGDWQKCGLPDSIYRMTAIELKLSFDED